MPHFSPSILVLVLAVRVTLAARPAVAFDEPPANREASEDVISRQRLQLFKDAVRSLKVTSPESTQPKFGETPILRYNDPAREFFDAGVWKLGTQGRPVALLTLELYRRPDGTTFLMHEFTSLTESALTIDTDLGVHWAPKPADLRFAPFPGAPDPADTEGKRLVQMRALARRFSAVEEYLGVKTTLRLLTQPIDRYTEKGSGIIDGALFAYAIGTNPEFVLLLEANNGKWMYALARTSSAETRVMLDDTLIKTFPAFVSEGRRGNYYAEGYPVDVPSENKR